MIKTGAITIQGHEIHYEWINPKLIDEGKPVIIFLHHGLGSIKQWGKFPERISNLMQCPALVYDRLGYGKSSAFTQARDSRYLHYEALTILPQLIEKLNITNKIILFGHSDGATIVLIYAAHHSEKLIAVVSEAPHVIIEEVSISGIKDSINDYENGVLKPLLTKYHNEKTDLMFYGWALTWTNVLQKDWNIIEEMATITTPVMVIYGDKDEYGTLEQINVIKKTVKNKVETVVIKECSHFPHKEKEEEVTTIVVDFLKKMALDI